MERYSEIKKWTENYFLSFDNQEEGYYDNFFDSNVVFQAANAEPIKGIEGLKQATQSVFGFAELVKHNLLQLIISAGNADSEYNIAVEVSVDYVLKNQKTLSLPCIVMLKVNNLKATEHKVFVDAAPLMKALSE